MKKLCTLLALAFCLNGWAQTLIYYENFGTGTDCATDYGRPAGSYTGADGSWFSNTTVGTNSVSANIWYVSQTEAGRTNGTCGETCIDSSQLFNKTLHIANVGGSPKSSLFCPTGDCGARYDNGGVTGNSVTTHIRAESPTISSAGYSTITLQFDYILGGDTINDYLTVWYFDGAVWNMLGRPAPTPTCAISANSGGVDGIWSTMTFVMPSSANNNGGMKIGFEWVNNDDGIGSNPSVAIDNVTLLASNATPLPSTLTVTIIPPDSANHNYTYCSGIPYNFTGFANPSATSYQWTCSPPTNVTFNPSPAYQNGEAITFPNAGTYTLTLHCNSTYGAKDTTLIVTVVQTPTVSVSPSSVSICNGGTGINLYATGATTYTWTQSLNTMPANYLNPGGDSVFVNPSTLQPPMAFTYSVTNISTNGCVSKPATASVTAIAPPTPYYIVSPATICLGGHTTLSVDSMPATSTYTWTNIGGAAGGLGGFAGALQQASPIYFGTVDTTFNYQVHFQMNIPSCSAIIPHTFTVHITSLPTVSYTLTPDATPHTWDAYPNYQAGITSATWYWGDGTSTTGLYPSHTYSVAGSYNVCVEVTNASGCVSPKYCQTDSLFRLANNSTYSSMVQLNVKSGIAGIAQVAGINNLVNIYPNPATTSLQVALSVNSEGGTILITDMLGNTVKQVSGINNQVSINVADLSEGVYNVSISSGAGVINKRVVIVK